MRVKLVAWAFGAAFGFMISWGHFTDPDEIRQMLLLEDLYLWKMFALAVTVGFVGSRLVRGSRAWVVRERVSWATGRPEGRHVWGAAVFGLGWAVATSCPAPIAAQLTQGMWWSVFAFAGVGAGVHLHLLQQEAAPGAATDAGPDTPADRAAIAGVPVAPPPAA